ncbi:hypothetical protein L3X38_037933 [Prunus dulcis]|uniref:Uncharacterized protein n=1 Tax=Prunus dulcis TaxID=3755 RepID=A0AAD4V437_PRUDU|nr:hypothetical protein L3X38_037933 [Prunus dulcis]
MATQIVYLDNLKDGSSWKVVQKMDHRNVYATLELDPTDNDVDNVADQRLESSMKNDVETLRDTNVIQEPFQIQGLSPKNNDDAVIEEEDWEIEIDDNDDNESYYSSDDE